jgi:drug/metabolite transporter (DMT)-like permease
MTVLVALIALPEERPSRTKIAGLLTGFAGVLVVLGPWRGIGASNGLAQAACLLATFCYGLAFVYLRRFVTPYRLPALSVATVQVGLGAVAMAALAPVYLTGTARLSPTVTASVAVLGMAGTGLAYLWNTNIVAAWGATNAATVTYLTPLVGVALGAAVLGEAITWNEPAGALIVIAGIALSQGRLQRKPRGAEPHTRQECAGQI